MRLDLNTSILALPVHVPSVKSDERTNDKLYENIFDALERIEEEEDDDYIWSGIKKGNFGYVFGPSKSGKTIICENLAMSIAAKNSEFLGMPINYDGLENVLFVSMEEFIQGRTNRNRKQIQAIPGINSENFKYNVATENFPLALATDKDWAHLESIIRDSNADFVIIDSFTRLTWDEIEKSHIASKISRKLRDLTYELGITMIVIHHSSKQKDSTLELASLAGSRVIGQEADFIIGINKLSNNQRYVKEVALRYKQESENVVSFRINDSLWAEKVRAISEDSLFETQDLRENPGSKDLVLSTIETHKDEYNKINTTSLTDILDGQIQKTRIYELLGEIEFDGKIKRHRGFIEYL